jgi:hypothetical protein
MTFEQQLDRVAEGYRVQGYQVVINPVSDVLPPFAKDFKVEVLATRPDGSVLASVKQTRLEVEADSNLPRYAEVVGDQPGWRFDLFVVGPEPEMAPENRDAKEPSEEEIRTSLDVVNRLLEGGFVGPSLITAWAALESAMRRRLRAEGEQAGWGTSPRTLLNELVSVGALSYGAFRNLEDLFPLRNAIAHGFSAPAVEASTVRFLVDTTRQLLDELHPVKQTA